MDHPPLLSSWDWLLHPCCRGIVLLDFRPGWNSIAHLEELISLEEFQERLARCGARRRPMTLRERVRKKDVV